MNVKLALILILLFLILLVLFYNINLESNIVILLGIIIILLINDLIKRSEYFHSSVPANKLVGPGNNIDSFLNSQLAELNALNTIVQTLNAAQQGGITEQNMNTNYPSIEVSNSCIKPSLMPETGTGTGTTADGDGGDGITDLQKSILSGNATGQ